MMVLILVLDVVQNLQGLLGGGRFHHHFLETALKRAILLDIFAVLIESRRTDTLDFTTRERRFQQVGGIHGAGCISCSHYGVEFINKQNHIWILRQLRQNRLDTLLKLTTVLSPGDNRSHVKRHHPLAEKNPRDLTLDDAQRKPLDNGRFAHPWLANEHRIVFLTPAKNLRQTFYLTLTPHNRVETAVLGSTGDVVAKFVESRRVIRPTTRTPGLGFRSILGLRSRIRRTGSPDFLIFLLILLIGGTEPCLGRILDVGNHLQHRLVIYPGLAERHDKVHMLNLWVVEQRQQQVLRIYRRAFKHPRLKHREFHQPVAKVACYDLPAQRGRGIVKRIIKLLAKLVNGSSARHPLQQREYTRPRVGQQRQEHMFRCYYAVVMADSLFTAILQNRFNFV